MDDIDRNTEILYPENDFAAYVQTGFFKKTRTMHPHCHTGFELLYFMEGESWITIRGREYKAGSGDLAVYHPGVAHEEHVQPGPYRIICLRFPAQNVNVPLPGQDALEPVIHLPWQERFHNVFEQIVLEKQGLDSWSPVMVGAYLVQFSVLLWRALSYYRQYMPDASEEHRIRISHIIELIHSRLHAEATLGELAGKAFMSESHFSHTFKDVVGVSPKRYMITARIEKARELLKMTDKSAVDIARTLGYETPHYFNRIFKKECGCTPLEFRMKSRNVQ